MGVLVSEISSLPDVMKACDIDRASRSVVLRISLANDRLKDDGIYGLLLIDATDLSGCAVRGCSASFFLSFLLTLPMRPSTAPRKVHVR